jgi:hypothetical protein
MKNTDIKSTLTTNQDIANLAIVLWDNSDYLIRSLTTANVLAKYRAKLVRMTMRMQREAMQLGECLEPPNKDAFVSLPAAKAFAAQLA